MSLPARGKRPSREPRRPRPVVKLAAVGKPPAAARAVALAVLLKARQRNMPGVDELIAEQRSRIPLSPADLGLARELASGVLRQRLWLETVLARYLERPLPEGARAVHETLLLGIYQALFLDRVPAHAIVDDAVRMVALHRTEASYQGLVNAILRRVTSADRASLLPDEKTPWPLRHSIPDWIAAEAGQSLAGEDIAAFFSAQNSPPPLHLRAVGTLSGDDVAKLRESLIAEIAFITHDPITVKQGRFLPACFVLPSGSIAPDRLPSFRTGHVTVMDEASQLVATLAGARSGMRVLDACASPGGKTGVSWDAMVRTGELVALDVSDRKLIRLRETLRRLKCLDAIRVGVGSEVLATLESESFDIVLIDAPCTGLGTIRRHPEIRWRRRPEDMADLVGVQSALLESHARLVKPGGHLVYSVCSFTREEGPRQVARFLATHGEFAAADAPEGLPFDAAPLAIAPGVWRTLTHRDGCDAFVVARLRRRT